MQKYFEDLLPPIYGLDSDYIDQQTTILQNKMKGLMEEFVRIDNNIK